MRGQVGFIAIIGVLVIIAIIGAVVIFTYDPTNPDPTDTSALFAVEQCLDASLDESIILVALYGGWFEPYSTQEAAFAMRNRAFPIWDSPAGIPTTSDIESRVSDLFEESVVRCASLLEGPGAAVVDVRIGPAGTRATIDMDAWIPGSSGAQQVPTFTVESDLPIHRALTTASQVTNELWADDILTELNFNLLRMNPDVPLRGVDFSCTANAWSVPVVRNSFFEGVESTVPFASYDGTPHVSNANVAPKITFELDTLPPDSTLSSYYFEDYGGSFEVDESTGDRMTSFVTKSPDGLLCRNTHQFWYSVDYPIVFMLSIPHSGDEFVFRFAVPVDVERNVEDDVSTSGDPTFCSEKTPTGFSIAIEDTFGASVPDATASITCDNERCPLIVSSGMIDDHLPSRCISGTISVDAEGYAQAEVEYRYDTSLGSSIELEPLTRISYTLTCDNEPCTFDDRVYAVVDGRSYPLGPGDNYVPIGDVEIRTLTTVGGAPTIAWRLTPVSGDVDLTIDTDTYADQSGGWPIQSIFGDDITAGNYGAGP